MHTYDDEIYTYLTQPENYRSAKQIAGQLSKVEERLITEFWQQVQQESRRQLNPTGWEVNMDPKYWFSIHRPTWKHLGVNCDSLHSIPDFGIQCKQAYYNMEQVKELVAAANVPRNEGMSYTLSDWPCFRHLSAYNFRQQHLLERILPENREETVKNLVTVFVEFVVKYEELLDRIHESKKY